MTLESQPSRANEVLAPKATPHRMGLTLNWCVVCTRSLTVLPVSRILLNPPSQQPTLGEFPDSFVSDRNKPVYSFPFQSISWAAYRINPSRLGVGLHQLPIQVLQITW